MAKKPCIYCQARPGTTKDHVFPFAWYPTTTPTTIQKRTVPCCLECNHRLHKAEDAVGLDLMAICEPTLPEIAGVHDRMRRAWKPDRARDGEDPKHRLGKPRKMMRTMEWAPPHPGGPIVYVQKNGVIRAASPARKIDKEVMRSVIEKFIRGLHYLEASAILAERGVDTAIKPLLPPDTRILYAFLPNNAVRMVDPPLSAESFPSEVVKALYEAPTFTMFGPGFIYRRLNTAEGLSTWLFRLWGQLEIIAFAIPSALAAEVEKAAGR